MTEAPMAAGIALLSAAGAALLRARIGSGKLMRAGFVVAVVALGFLTAIWFVVTPRHAAEYLARMGAIIAAVMTISSTGVQWTYGTGAEGGIAHTFVRLAQHLAILFGVIAGTILAIVLGVRGIYVAIELITVLPTRVTSDYGFTREGAGSLALLLIASAVGFGASAAGHLSACILASATMAGVWLALEEPVLDLDSTRGLTRSLGFSLLGVWLAAMLLLATFQSVFFLRRDDHDTGPAASEERVLSPRTIGWRLCCALLVFALIMHVTYPLIVPLEAAPWNRRVDALLQGGAALLGAFGCYQLASRLRSGNLADGAYALLIIAHVWVSILFLPASQASLTERYPAAFNAMLIGLSASIVSAALLARYWTDVAERQTDDDRAAMFRFHAKRGIFTSGAVAVVIGGMMALWPRLQGIAATDFSLARVSVGFAAFLVLSGVLLACARVFGRTTYYVLSGLAFAAGVLFMMIRILPFTPHFG